MMKMRFNTSQAQPEPRLKKSAGDPLPKRVQLITIFLAIIGPSPVGLLAQEPAAQLQTAAALHEKGDYAHSIPLLKQIVLRSPRNYNANLLLGEDLLRSGDARSAVAPLQRACTASSDDGAASSLLAEAEARLGDFYRASLALEAAIKHSTRDDRYSLEWAGYSIDRLRTIGSSMRMTKKGEGTQLRFEAAAHAEGSSLRESLLQESAARNPDQPGIWGELGVAQLELGNIQDAKKNLEEARRREPQASETLQLEALVAAMAGDWSAAARQLSMLGARSPAELRRVLALWPRTLMPGPEVTGEVWNCLRDRIQPCPISSASSVSGKAGNAASLYQEGRWEQLIALPSPAPSNLSPSLWRGVAYARTGQCLSAIPWLEAGMKASQSVASFWLQICYGSEVERVAALLNTNRNDAALHQLRGDVQLQLHANAAAAQKEYAKALEEQPNNLSLLERQAQAYLAMGDSANAQSMAESALKVDPHSFPALQTLAQVALNNQNYDDALPRLKQLEAINPADTWTRVQLGLVYAQLGHAQEALHYLGPSLAAGYPDEKGGLHAQLAAVLRKLGRREEAKAAAAEAERLANASLLGANPETTNAHQ